MFGTQLSLVNHLSTKTQQPCCIPKIQENLQLASNIFSQLSWQEVMLELNPRLLFHDLRYTGLIHFAFILKNELANLFERSCVSLE